MKYPVLPTLVVFILLHGCISSGNTISPDETAKKIFTRAELEGFDRMIHLVDSIVSAKTGLTGINESYNAYIDKLSSDVFSGGNFTPLLNDGAKFQFLELIDNEAFSAIWGKQTIHPDWSSRPIQMLYLNSGGKYKRYLQKVGESDEWYARIYEEIDRSGDFSPVIVAGYLKNHHEHDFTLYKHRLWATVFLLNIAEPLEVSEMPTQTVLNYLHALTNAFFVYRTPRVDVKGLKVFEIGEKYYFEDLGLRNAIRVFNPSNDINKLMANAVFMHLLRNGHNVFVGNNDGKEIDFVAERNNERVFIQVAYMLHDQRTIDREFGNLMEIGNHYPKYVVTMDSIPMPASYHGIQQMHLRTFLSNDTI